MALSLEEQQQPGTGPTNPNMSVTPPGAQTMMTTAAAGTQAPTGVVPPPTVSAPSLPPIEGQQFVAGTQQPLDGTGVGGLAPTQVVQDTVSQILNQSNPYITSARRHGLEAANARGLMNSSIAAGASERAAIDASMPLVQQSMGLFGDREQRAFQGQQSQLDRLQGVNNAMLQSQLQERQAQLKSHLGMTEQAFGAQLREGAAANDALRTEWLSNNDWTNKMNFALASANIGTASDLTKMVAQMAGQDPETWTPQSMTGFMQLLGTNLPYLLSAMMGNLGTTTGGSGG